MQLLFWMIPLDGLFRMPGIRAKQESWPGRCLCKLWKTSTLRPDARHPLSEIIRAFKSFSAWRINKLCKTSGIPIRQRNYYEHIIRNGGG
jgi:hypothetical protein